MNHHTPRVWLATLVAIALHASRAEERMVSIDNGQIRVGVDLSIGGAITHVSDLARGDNLINSHDWGRQIQMSFYSGPPNYQREGKRKSPHWAGFPWNPIQSGDAFGNGSRTLEHRAEEGSLYVKAIPMLWPMENDPGECSFETWITLEGKTFRYRGRLTNQRADKTVYGPHHQEVPAVYTNAVWHRLMTYVGDQPFTGGALTEVRKTAHEAWPWSKWLAAENWAALVDDSGFGIGAWHPEAYEFHGGFAGARGKGGPKDAPTGYFSPMQTEVLDPDIVYEYECVFVVGTLEEIRAYVYAHAPRQALPAWTFQKDRQHWTFHQARSPWPLAGALALELGPERARLESPLCFWQAQRAPRLRLRGAFRTRGTDLRLSWRPFSGQVHTVASWQDWARTWWTPERSLVLTVRNDGTPGEYVADLATAPDYRGALGGLAIDLPESAAGDRATIEAVRLEPAP